MKVCEVELPDVDDAFGWFEHTEKVAQVTSAMTGIGVEVLQKLRPETMIFMFIKYLLPMVRELTAEAPKIESLDIIETFTHKGKRYYMPESLPIFGDVVLMHGQTAKRFVEASNLLALYSKMRKTGIQTMPLFVATIVRETKDEQWDEAVVAERAKDMLTLPMDVFWNVFFCTMRHTTRQMSDTLRSMLEKEKPKRGTRAHLDMKRGLLELRKRELREAWQMLTR
jgi:hypothetical protein